MTKQVLITEDNGAEMFPEVDENGNIIGAISRGEAHSGTKRLHPVVHLHVFDSAARLYLQQRADWKEIQPGKWDTAVGGHVDLGESTEQALLREAGEELGLQPGHYTPQFITSYVYESTVERELVYIYRTTIDDESLLHPSATETQGGRFWADAEIRASIGRNTLTPMFEQEYKRHLMPNS